MRELLMKHGGKIAIGLLLLTGIIVYMSTFGGGTNVTPEKRTDAKAYFYDEETNERVVRSVMDVPPVEGKSGKPTVVRAMYIKCPDGQERLAYLEKYSPEIQAELKRRLEEAAASKTGIDNTTEPIEGLEAGHFLRGPEPGSPWVASNDPRAKSLYMIKCPDGSKPQVAKP